MCSFSSRNDRLTDIATGGDNIFTPTTDFVTLDTQDEVLAQYIQSQSPIDIALGERIVVTDGPAATSNTPGINPRPGGNNTANSTSGASQGVGVNGSATGTAAPSPSASTLESSGGAAGLRALGGLSVVVVGAWVLLGL